MNNGSDASASTYSSTPATAGGVASGDYLLRAPRADEARAIHRLVAQCPPLDPNSLYCNLLQCTHFAQTCAVAFDDARLAAFVSGYRLPEHPDALFIWQIAVSAEDRGQGLAKRLVRSILARPASHDIRSIRATVTPANASSRAMFRSLARELDTAMEERALFDAVTHFGNQYDSEHELDIGPFQFSSAP